ncbi:hypothetical protein N0V92_008924 [Colletotrichum tropicale]|nr:hypothetical protein N0V92_008924 [Colletotrichum tropicale]
MFSSSQLSFGCAATLLASFVSADSYCSGNELVSRHILEIPNDVVKTPVYSDFRGDAIIFFGVPASGGRSEIFQTNEDGSGLICLSCGVSPGETRDLTKPFAFKDESPTLTPINVPTYSGADLNVIQPQREMRIAPDGQHVGYTQVALGKDFIANYLAVIGELRLGNCVNRTEYMVDNPRVVAGDAELKQFSSNGKSLVVATFAGVYGQANADAVLVDLITGNVTRLTTHVDYDEDVSISPNGRWLSVGSSRTLQYTAAMSQIERPTLVPGFVVGPVFSMAIGTVNQPWLISRADELDRKEGLRLWVPDDGFTSQPVSNWKDDGSAVTFWESTGGLFNPNNSRIVVARPCNDAGSLGTVSSDTGTPTSTWAPTLKSFVAARLEDVLPGPGTYQGQISGTATIVDTADPISGKTQRTVTYSKLKHLAGQVIDGIESSIYDASLNDIVYSGSLTVSNLRGVSIGSLDATNVSIVNQTAMVGTIRSVLNGESISVTARSGSLTVESSPVAPANPW